LCAFGLGQLFGPMHYRGEGPLSKLDQELTAAEIGVSEKIGRMIMRPCALLSVNECCGGRDLPVKSAVEASFLGFIC